MINTKSTNEDNTAPINYPSTIYESKTYESKTYKPTKETDSNITSSKNEKSIPRRVISESSFKARVRNNINY